MEDYFKSKERSDLEGIELSRSLCYIERKLHHLDILANLEDIPQNQMNTSAGKGEKMTRMQVKPKFNVEKHQLVLLSGVEANFRVAREDGGKAWVVGKDVSGLVAEWKGYDLFEKRLKSKGLQLDVRRLAKADDGFEELKKERLVGEADGEVFLYSLEDLPLVLTKINPNAATVLARFWNSTRRG